MAYLLSQVDYSTSAALVRKSALLKDGQRMHIVALSGPTIFTATTGSAVPITISGRFTTNDIESTSSTQSSSSVPAYIMCIAISGPLLVAIYLAIYAIRRFRARRHAETQTLKETDASNESNDVHSNSGVDLAHRASWSPFIESSESAEAVLRSDTISTRQLYISNQVHRARQKVAELEKKSIRLRVSLRSTQTTLVDRPSSSNGDVPLVPAVPPTNEEDTVNDALVRRLKDELEGAVRQIEVLNSRINELEQQRRSS